MEPSAPLLPASSRRPFVGRAAERAELDAGLADALAGRARLFLIAGEPGIGKTRLMDEAGERAQAEGATVVMGRAWDAGGAPPYWPWVQILRACLRNGSDAALGRDRAILAQIVPELYGDDAEPRLVADSEEARFRLFDATARLLARVAGDRPHALLLDDVHAADPSSLLLLQFVVRELRGARLLLIATYRDAEARRLPTIATHLAALGREGRHLALSGLAEEQVGELVAAASGRTLSAAAVGTVHRATGGNPFFVDEVARTIVGERPGDLRVPDTVREAIRQRLALLGEGVRDLLAVAAVIGREFDLHLIDRIPSRPAVPFLETIREATAAGLVQASGAPGRFAFAHDLVRETLRAELAPTRRIELHHELGELLEAMAATEAEPSYAALAHHFYFAAPLAGADKAVTYAARAGDQAMRQCAYDEAIALYARALQAMDLRRGPIGDPHADGLERCGLLLRLAKAEHSGAGLVSGRGAAQRAAMLAERLLATSDDPRAHALLAEATELGAAPSPATIPTRTVASAADAAAVFRKEGDFWTIAFAGILLRLKDARGFFYLHHLLRHPGQEFHALDLVEAALGGARPAGPRRPAHEEGDPQLDAAAKSAYRSRLADLREELAEAEAQNDLGRAEHLRTEIEAIARELSSALGLGGRDRRAASDAERSRVAVTKAILAALKTIAAGNPALRAYLGSTVRTGRLCTYVPDPGRTVAWDL